MNPLSSLRSLAARGADALTDLDRLRRIVFNSTLVVGAFIAATVALTQTDMVRPELVGPFRLALGVWTLLHLPFFLLGRRARPRPWYLAHVAGAFVVILTVFASVALDPIQTVGMQCTYHAGILVEAMLLLSFTDYAAFAVFSGAIHIATTLLRVKYMNTSSDIGMATGLVMPLATILALTSFVALLLERYHRGMAQMQVDLKSQNERLEALVSRRTQVIEEQQAQLFQMHKMEAIGTLAGGVAHDFNNLLTPILALASEIRMASQPSDQVHEAAQLITRSAERAAQLNRQLLGFARKGKLQSVPVDMHKLLQEVGDLLSRTLERHISIQVRLEAEPRFVVGDPIQLQQVVLNLAVNARDAMPRGGDLRLTASTGRISCASDPGPRDLPPGRYLLLAVADTGTGIPPDIRERIFEPFFTTKPAGQGTGMGLAMVYGIVKNHGGSVELTSEVGRGSRFCIWLPATERGPTAISRPPLPVAGSGRILVVDDEDLVRATAERLLTGIGYKVQTARDGVEALAKVQAQPGDFDLVLLDLGMPRMDGLTCLRALKQHAPSVRMLVSTGYALDGATEQALAEGACGCLPKPYLLTELAEAVRQALHPPPASGSPTSL